MSFYSTTGLDEPTHKGTVVRLGQTRTEPFEMRRLSTADLPTVQALHDLAHSVLPEPGLLAREEPAFFAAHIEAVGRMYGAFVGERMIAYCVLGLPVDSSYNFGLDIGLPADELPLVAHVDGAVVDPDYRRNGLHRVMITWRIDQAAYCGRRHVLSTAAPRNLWSWSLMTRHGLLIVGLKQKFGGFWRYLHHLDLKRAILLEPEHTIEIDVDELERQQSLFAQGYVGVGLVFRERLAHIRLVRRAR